jgi:hypothetical protein
MLDTDTIHPNFSTQLDLLEMFNNITEKGAIIEISMLYRDYSLAEISRIVENNGMKILSAHYAGNQYSQENSATLTLKLNQENMSALLATFERFGYQIEGVYQHEAIDNIEQGRYDMLMKYLDI